ncbi:hypothetical protein B7494_g165 [Chlorociboria aeruginascens]|nr:hypothetical protein B7494_g165 [Chlorociboria aeruginascens]
MGSRRPFTLKDEPVENLRPLKVRVIGAGYSGIYLGVRIPQRLRNIDLQVYEQNEVVGGTWWMNRYPGCACDVPSHSYQYSFDPNPNWSSLYAPAEEICGYLQGIAEKYGVMRYVKRLHKVTSCRWLDGPKKWRLSIEKLQTGETLEEDADILISARGNLSAMEALGLDPSKFEFTAEQRHEFATDPEKYLKFRKTIEADGNKIHGASFQGSDLQKFILKEFSAMMKKRLSKKPEIVEALIPSFAVGCRRLTPGPGYLEALVESNVEFISDKIASITPDGIVLETGRNVDIDVLVCATGFETSAPPPWPVTGKYGKTLQERFTPYPESYLTMAIDGFPNYFMMLGPNSAIGSGSLTVMIESTADYIIKCIRKLQKEDYASMMPKPERVADFSDYVGQYFKNTVYMDECNSWYRSEGGKGNRITGLWPGSTLHFLETVRAPRWEDFEYESKDANQLRWIGNGWSTTQIEGGGDPAWYLEPVMQDIPVASLPEEDAILKMRPFSH